MLDPSGGEESALFEGKVRVVGISDIKEPQGGFT